MAIQSTDKLLNDILRVARLPYVSDIHNSKYANEVLKAVQSLPAEEYSVAAWNTAIIYVVGEKELFEKQKQAQKFLIACLKARISDSPQKK